MSNYPNSIDDDSIIPQVSDNITEIGAEVLNELRSAVFNIENELGLGLSGSTSSLAQRLGVSIAPNGTILPSALTGLGLVTLPIYNSEIASSAGIQESKLNLTFPTQTLYDLYVSLQNSISIINNFISITGVKVEPHINGSNYNHLLSAIRVDSSNIFTNKNGIGRNTTDLGTLLEDINSDLIFHEKSDGTSAGTIPPTNYGHVGTGIFLDTTNFATIPRTVQDVQSFAEFADSSGLLLLGSRTQNLFDNGIPRSGSLSTLISDGYFPGSFGQTIVPATNVSLYLVSSGTSPVDDINTGDDVILFNPTSDVLSNNVFDSQFAQVKSGDILTVYDGQGSSPITVSYIIDSVKALFSGSSKVYAVRINGKNLFNGISVAKITKSLYNENKFGVLSVAQSPNNISNAYESLIVANPRGASVLGIGFNPYDIDANHYNLYLTLYPTGNPKDKIVQLPPVDITGNAGATPGQYTLDTIVESCNNAFRANGFNYRFIAFSYSGEFGVMLADHFNNASFSIISGTVDGYGNYSSTSLSSFPNNVIDIFNNSDALGFGLSAANVASPPYAISYSSPEAAQNPTRIFVPLKSNFFYVNGSERDKLKQEIDISLDSFGDGYWSATIPVGGKTVLLDRVQTIYNIPLDLRQSGLKVGKTIVVQPEFSITGNNYSIVDYGRFTISNVSFSNCSLASPITTITVYDSIHATGISPFVSSQNISVRLYFSDDSVAFDSGNVSDSNSNSLYNRFFEVYVDGSPDQNGHTFTHERARFITSGIDISKINILSVSPKLTGYKSSISNGSPNQIKLNINSFNSSTGLFDGYLSAVDGTSAGLNVFGKKGEICRFYDATTVDYIDFIFNLNDTVSSFTNINLVLDIFSSLQEDKEVLLLATCQVNDSTKKVSYLRDARTFGNTSEKQFTTSASNYITSGDRLLHQNGVIQGFNIISTNVNSINISGGSALVNGKIVNVDNEVMNSPILQELYLSANYNKINWALCINNKNEFQFIPLTDYDSTSPATPNAPNRLFTAFNPINNSSYVIDSNIFSDLINNRKDLTVLYVVSTNVSGSGAGTTITLTIKDIKKYAFEATSNIEATLNTNNSGSQGNFKSLQSLIFWLNNNSSQSKAIIKGNNSVPSTLNFNFNNPVELDGQSNANSSIIFNATQTISNVKFSNINIVISAVVSISNNVQFNNCNITTISPLTIDGTNVVINNCSFSGVSDSNSFIIVKQTAIITNNIFTRNSTVISSYINCTYPTAVNSIITDNVFDSTTVDGITDQSVSPLVTLDFVNINYSRNKNQIAFKIIPFDQLSNKLYVNSAIDTSLFVQNDTAATKIHFKTNTINQYVIFSGEISSFLPDNVNILSATVGGYLFSGTGLDTTSSNNFSIYIIQTPTISTNTSNRPTSFAGSIVDAFVNSNYENNEYFNGFSINSSNLAAFSSATQYVHIELPVIDISFSGLFTNQNYGLVVKFEVNINTTSSGTPVLRFSPLLIKYMW